MPAGANTRHVLGLLLAAGGALCVVLAAVFLLAGNVMGEPGAFACAGLLAVPGGLLLWRGLVMRNRAARTSTIFNDDDGGDEWTSRTEAAKPSFLKGKRRPPPPDDF